MDFQFFLILAVAIAILIFVLIRSKQAKGDIFCTVHIPEGMSVAEFRQYLAAELPSGWMSLGQKASHIKYLQMRDWNFDSDGGNLLDITSGIPMLARFFVISVDLKCETIDPYGRMIELDFDELPPQSEYKLHAWVSFSSVGQGTIWGPITSHLIIKAKEYLVDRIAPYASSPSA